jgi:elongation factor G
MKNNKLNINRIRNFSISAHVDAGKTTITEDVLFHTGIIHKKGDINEQNTQMDWRKEERERGITIMSDATSCLWKNYFFNIIDTPGHRDFSAEVIRCFTSIDFVLGVFCAVGGVEPQTKFVWSKIEQHKLPVLSFINKLDRIGANFFNVIDEISENFLIKTIPIILPLGLSENFIGFIDLINDNVIIKNDKIKFVDFKQNINTYKGKYPFLSKDLEEIFFNYTLYKSIIIEEAKSSNKNDIIINLKKKLINREITLVCGGSAKLDIGIVEALDFIVDFGPSPIEKNDGKFTLFLKNDYNTKLVYDYKIDFTIIYIFKIVFDDFLGRFTYVKIYSGKIKKGDVIYNIDKKKKEKISRIVKVHANKRSDLEEAIAGDIVGIVGFKYSYTNDTLCNKDKFNYELERIKFPQTIINKSIKPKTKKDQENLSEALNKMHLSDPTIKHYIDYNTGEIILSGLGELHLDVNISMLYSKYKVNVISSQPKIAYKETITKSSYNVEGSYIRQSGGRGHFAIIYIDLEQNENEFEFVNKLRGQQLDRKFIPAIEDGLKDFMLSGSRARCPVINIKVTLLDGESHSVDSSELSFKNAAYDALKKAYTLSIPRMLEPIMLVSLITPKEYLGVIMSDIYSKRGNILSNVEKQYDVFGKIIIKNIIEALIPLEHLSNYSDNILALSKGQAVQTNMSLHNYEFIPDHLEEKKAQNIFSDFYKKKK